jgi:hypothetical protein
MVHLLQCRPQSNREEERNLQLPTDIPRERTLFTANKLVPQGRVSGIRYIVYVDPDCYSSARDYATKLEMARLVGRLNRRLEGERFILMGPGRWGSANVDLGVKVTYADIYNTRMLIEMTSGKDGAFPEASYGTHFFQDLVEAEIHPLILYPEDRTVFFNRDFFANAANVLGDLLPADQGYADLIKVIDVSASSGGKLLEVIMNGEQEMALGYLTSTPPGKA